MSDATWLPNLVGGVSIWKLGVDLNEPKFFDGRLLVPETEGSESLPVTVRWDLANLVPLKDAQAQHPEDVATATREFQACLERVAKVFSTPNSGFDKYKEAFTVPSLEADGGANYFYSPAAKKLFAINWGASPRSMGGKSEYVFGYEDWGKHWGDVAVAGGAGAAGAVAGAVAAKVASTVTGDEKKADEKKPDEKKKDDKKRPWWMWPLFALIAIALVLLTLFLLRSCEEPKAGANADAAADALAADGAADGAADASGDASDDAAALGDAEAGVDAASADGGDGGDAGKDASDDASAAMDDDDDDDDGQGGGSVKVSSGGAGGGGGGKIVVEVGPGGGSKTAVHRKHYHDDAVKWRVGAGSDKVSRTEQRGKRFDVWLSPGKTFEGVRVEWQDKGGKWHPH